MKVYLAVNYPAPYRIKMLDAEASKFGWEEVGPMSVENGRYLKSYSMETPFEDKPAAEKFAKPLFEEVLHKVDCAMVAI